MATLRPTHRLHRQTQLIALLGLVAALLSAPVTAAAQPPPARLAGPDRYATAAAVVEATFDQATTVYVATGEGFADALAGGPRAALDGAPILLVQREAIPAPTATELARLQPQRIVILGGPGAVSDAVRQQLQATGAQVQRLAGASRFATAAAISRDGFSPGVGIAYLATGDTFPDALAGGAAGGLTGGPVLLLSGTTIPAETAAELARLQPQTVALLGGPAAIPDTIVLEARPTHRRAGAPPGRRRPRRDRRRGQSGHPPRRPHGRHRVPRDRGQLPRRAGRSPRCRRRSRRAAAHRRGVHPAGRARRDRPAGT